MAMKRDDNDDHGDQVDDGSDKKTSLPTQSGFDVKRHCPGCQSV